MSTIPTGAALAPRLQDESAGRSSLRSHARRRLERIAYVGFGPDNGGILLDVSEGGLRFHVVGGVLKGQLCRVKFTLPGARQVVESNAHIVWADGSGRGGGLQFLDLSDETRLQIQAWVAAEATEAQRSAPPLDPAQRAANGSGGKWPGGKPSGSAGTDSPAAVAGQRGEENPPAPLVPPQPQASAKTGLPAWLGGPPPIFGTLASGSPRTGRGAEREPEAAAAGPRLVVPRRAAHALAVSALALAAVAGAGTAWLLNTPSGTAATGAEETTEFEVEVTDAQQRRWVLSNRAASPGTRTAAPAPARPPAALQRQTAPVQSAAAAPPAVAARPAPAPPPAPPVAQAQRPEPSAPGQLALNAPRTPVASSSAGSAATPAPTTVQQASLPSLPAPAPAASAVPPAAPFVPPAASEPAPPGSLFPPAQPAAPPAATPSAPIVAAPRAVSFTEAVVVQRVEPVYPAFARQTRVEGTVEVRATVGPDGVPRNVTSASGNPWLRQAAVEAVRRWRYRPAQRDGAAVESEVMVNIQFRLQR